MCAIIAQRSCPRKIKENRAVQLSIIHCHTKQNLRILNFIIVYNVFHYVGMISVKNVIKTRTVFSFLSYGIFGLTILSFTKLITLSLEA